LALREIRPGESPTIHVFSNEQIEILAEMEHGRWVVERLLAGWTYGQIRDDQRKIRPQLISWADLPEAEREKDRESVRKTPQKLADAGYEIVKLVDS
jgi:hypothetical protein